MTALAAIGAGSASAIEFEFGDGWKGSWNTTLSYTQSWRTDKQDNKLYSRADGLVRGFTDGLGGSNTDAGDLNYDQGDAFSMVGRFITDLSVSKGNTGAYVRVKGWYDYLLEEKNVPYGNQAQNPRYTPNTPLGDDGLRVENRFTGIRLLDAYAYTQFDVGANPLQVRLGNQVINWGESVFIQGVNVTSPIDVPALRRGAGTEIKEFLVPVPMAYFNLGLPNGMSMEAFYQAKWERTAVDACGTYFSPSESAVSYQAGSCNIATTFGGFNNRAAIAAGQYVKLVDGPKPSDGGQFGVAFRFPVEKIDTEFAFFYQNLHSRTPIISVQTGQPLPVGTPGGLIFLPGGSANASAGFWEYPEDIQIFGISAATNFAGWATGFELSYTKDIPAQINGNDLIAAFLQGAGPVGLEARTLAGRVAGTPAAPIGTVFHGYDRFDKWQFQANAIQLFSNVLGASTLTIVAEAGFQWNNVPDYGAGGHRYGRGFIFGLGTNPTIAGGANLCAVPVAAGGNPQPDGCKNDGYVTDYAWGLRLRGALTYNDVFGTGITATPSVFVAKDIEGVAIDGQFNEGRAVIAAGLKLEFAKRYYLDLAYTYFDNGAKWDNLRDRDFFSVGLSVTF
jgi:hypothetical protein